MIKRRRGAHAWFDTVTWEIGPVHRELHTPGGLYLLLHRLMARGRAISGSGSLWSTWRNGLTTGSTATIGEHHDPFAHKLSPGLNLSAWARRHDLRTDAATTSESGDPLGVHLRLLRRAVEVRRTRSAGGHLPSAARSNSVAVLFSDYLRGDPTVRDWADSVVADAVVDAENAAFAAHRETLGASQLRVQHDPATAQGAVDGAWSACSDPDHHPRSGRSCRQVSFLDCFHCGNCVITPTHLPAILALLDSLTERRERLGEQDWWHRYGPTWAAIRGEVLTKFTPAQVSEAASRKPTRPLLDIAENPWEQP